ncbi:MAG: type II toxin-antitoxin system Phd/YefM family antitoxin [Phycisphaerae bacterium]
MTALTVSKARTEFAEIVNRVAYGGERITINRRGKAAAVLVSVEDAKLLESLEDAIDTEAARKALKERGKPIPLALLKKRLGL